MAELPKTLLFLDIETTGLKPDAQLLELAAILVRAHDLTEVSRFHALARPTAGICDQRVWDPAVVAMHSRNMLLADIVSHEALDRQALLERFANWLTGAGQPTRGCYIAGSSVHTDVAFLKRLDVPTTEGGVTVVPWGSFSHRILDLSSLRTFDTMNGTQLFPDKKPDDNHRAMSDCEQDWQQLAAAREAAKTLLGWVPKPSLDPR